MTRRTIEVEKKVTTTKVVGYMCDWCGDDFDHPTWDGEGGDEYEVEIKLSTRTGGDYGWEVGGKTRSVEDLCPDCAKKLPDALRSLGMNVREEWW